MFRTTTILAAVLGTSAVLAVAACGDDEGTATTAATGAEAVKVSGAWARVTPQNAKAGAAYMTITSAEDDTLTAVSVPASIAGDAQLHETTSSAAEPMDEEEMSSSSMSGMTAMKEVEEIPVPAGDGVQLKPGGYHVMLMELAEPLTAGQTVPLTLTFAEAGEVRVDAVARAN